MNSIPSPFVCIAVFGCGGIGARHLQSLARLDLPATLYAVDPSLEALERARSLFEEWQQAGSHPGTTLTLLTDPRELPATLDVAIIATRAQHRLQALQMLFATTTPRHLILEKFLFATRGSFAVAVEEVIRSGALSHMVNCPRRIYPGYQAIASHLAGARYVDLRVSASARIAPLGTIGIHFVDLLDFLCGGNGSLYCHPIEHGGLIQGNRQLRDFAGRLRASIDGSAHGTMTVDALPDTMQPLWVTIDSDRGRFVVNEREQILQRSLPENGWAWETESFMVPFQSMLTNIVTQALLRGEDAGLTPFIRSVELHLPLLDALMNCYRQLEDNFLLEEIPFT